MKKLTIRDMYFTGKRVLIRADFNVPIQDGKITDDTRIRAAIPTIQHVRERNPKGIILMSHLGRPKGARAPQFSLAPIAPALSVLLNTDVQLAPDCIGPDVEKAIADLAPAGILLLENTRFHEGETKNDPDFARQLATHGDLFINDAFGTVHRAHASNVGVSEHVTAVAGLLLEKEINYLSTALENPDRPFVAILGGAKVSDKIGVIQTLLQKVDRLLIGGGMANTFFKAQGHSIGSSLSEAASVETAQRLLQQASDKLILPADVLLGDAFDNNANTQVIEPQAGVPVNWSIYDIGPASLNAFGNYIQAANTIVWNGPMGVFEIPKFAQGTLALADLLAKQTHRGAVTIVGGGDSVAAIDKAGVTEEITHISTGGGASLELLEGKTLPGLAALTNK